MPLLPDPLPHTLPGVVVALHSSGAGGRQWQAWRAALPAGIELRAPELLGYDAAGWGADQRTSLDEEAQRVLASFEDVPGGVHLLGHSYGGAVALQLALRWPARVRSLTLYEPVRFALLREHDRPAWREVQSLGRGVAALVRQSRLEQAGETFVDYWTRRGQWAALPPQRRRAVAERMPKVAAEFDALFTDPLVPAALATLRVPPRLLCGSRSPQPVRTVAERLAAACPGAALVRLEGLGHLGPIDEPLRVAAQLLPQLARPWPAAA